MQDVGKTPGGSVKKPTRIFYGWWVITAVSALYVLGTGIYWVGFSFYFLPITRDLSLSRTSMSLALGLARLVGGLQGPLAGYLVDRLGPRRMIIFGGFLGGLGFILLALTHSYLTFLLVYLGLIVTGFSGGFDQGIISLPSRWFVRRRALAMSFLWVGISLGNAVVVPVVGLMVVNLGWRDTATLSGVVMIALVVPVFLIVRNLPEDMGLKPDGRRNPSSSLSALREGSQADPSAEQVPPSGQEYSQVDFTARQGLRTVSYWLLALAMGLRIAAGVALFTHFVPIIVWKGQTETKAALLLAIYGTASIFLCLLIGVAGDRWSKQKMTSCGMLLGALSMLVLIVSDGQLWQLVIFMLLLTLADSTGVVTWALVGDLFGRKAFATLLGGMTLVYSLLSAATPIVAGWIFDSTDSYLWALLLIVILYAGACLLFWNIPRPKLPSTTL